jgi:hypothetical protein
VTGCATTAVAVKIKSAITTIRATPAITAGRPPRWAISIKNAIPAPVPSSMAAPMTWRNLRPK